MKSRKTILLVAGVLLLLGSALVYGLIPGRFDYFLFLFIPGIALFSIYFLSSRPRIKIRRQAALQAFLLLMMLDSILVTLYGLYPSSTSGSGPAPAKWAMLVVAGLGFLTYIATLALWHWKRWGLALFQGASVALAAFILLAGGSLLLAGFIVLGVVVLSMLLRSVRKQMA